MYCRRLLIPKVTGFSWWALHHFYSGFLILLAGFVMIFYVEIADFWPYSLISLGLWVMIDDVIQHLIQRFEIKRLGCYYTVTFWHWIFEQFRGEEYAE